MLDRILDKLDVEQQISKLTVEQLCETYGMEPLQLIELLEANAGKAKKRGKGKSKSTGKNRRKALDKEEVTRGLMRYFENVDWNEERPRDEIAGKLGVDPLALDRALKQISDWIEQAHGWRIVRKAGARGRGGKPTTYRAVQSKKK